MPRNPEDARQRLRHAAIELFAEHGFDHVTAAEIAARAGVTERTFFRHFADKREVLFDGQEIIGAALADAIAKAPAGLPPMVILRHAFADVAGIFEANRRYSEPRQRLILTTPALQERDVAKGAALTRSVAHALEARGIDPQPAELAAKAGAAVLHQALSAWFADATLPLTDHLDRAFDALQALLSEPSR